MNTDTGFRAIIPQRTIYAALVAVALGAAILCGILLTRDSAHAANVSVTTGSPNNRFSPNVSNINVGDTVTFTWSAGTHIVDLKDVSPDLAVDSGHTSGKTNAFATAGTYYYYCSIHATADQATEAHVAANDVMVGKIVVAAATGGPTTPAAGATPAPAAPGTGNSAAADGSDAPAFIFIAGALAALAGLAAFAVSRR